MTRTNFFIFFFPFFPSTVCWRFFLCLRSFVLRFVFLYIYLPRADVSSIINLICSLVVLAFFVDLAFSLFCLPLPLPLSRSLGLHHIFVVVCFIQRVALALWTYLPLLMIHRHDIYAIQFRASSAFLH